MYAADLRGKLGEGYEVEGSGLEIYVSKIGLRYAKVVLKQECRVEGWNVSQTRPIVLEVEVRAFGQIMRSSNKPVFCSDPEAAVLIIKRLLNTPEDMSQVGKYEG
jgi:hypothetical protein